MKVALALASSSSRRTALSQALDLVGTPELEGKDVWLKASYNSAHPFPATTHPETLTALVEYLRNKNCGRILLAERSGMGNTREVWKRLEVSELASKLELTLLPLEDLPPSGWRGEALPGSSWSRGVEIPRELNLESRVVQIANLKTHRFGGHFSASLKNSLGLVAKYSSDHPPHNYMAELHSSPQQREMIADVNRLYHPLLVVIDAMQVFVDGGPETGDLASPDVIFTSRDRVAADAAGVALLRHHGAGFPLSKGTVFEQGQLARAVQLGLGARSGAEIEILTGDSESRRIALQLRAILEQVPPEKKP